jgi:hypothetical protein
VDLCTDGIGHPLYLAIFLSSLFEKVIFYGETADSETSDTFADVEELVSVVFKVREQERRLYAPSIGTTKVSWDSSVVAIMLHINVCQRSLYG